MKDEKDLKSGDTGEQVQKENGAVIDKFVRRLATLLQAEKVLVMLYSPETSELIAQAPAVGIDPIDLESLSWNVDIDITGQVFKSGKSQIVDDLQSHPLVVRDVAVRLGLKNAVLVPLMLEKKGENGSIEKVTIGVVLALNKNDNKKFSKEDENLLAILVRNSSSIIGNVNKYGITNKQFKQIGSTFDSMHTGIISISNDNHEVLSINAEAARILGIPKNLLLHRNIDKVELHDEVREVLTQAFECNECVVESQIGCNIYRVDIGINGRHTNEKILIFNDVTDLKSVEQLKTNLVSAVSHELRTPLTVIKGFISTLLTDPEGEFYDNDSRMEFYTIIDTECDRLVRLINDLLSISRIERGLALQLNYTKFNVIELIEQCVAFQSNYTDKHRIIFEKPYDEFEVVADKDKLDQIIINLIGNAVKYSPDGGDILVGFKDLGDDFEITVEDHGMGIAEEHIQKIFECFHRVENNDSRKIGGTGIGLFLVKNLVEAHEGTIAVSSVVGTGSIFKITIPVRPKEI